MTIGYSTSLRDARAQAIVDALDAGSAGGKATFYGATRPATGEAVVAQIEVATCIFGTPGGVVSNGVITFAEIEADNAGAAGVDISWVRLSDSDDNFVADMDCGLTGSGAEFIFDDVSSKLGGGVKIASGGITEGNS